MRESLKKEKSTGAISHANNRFTDVEFDAVHGPGVRRYGGAR